MENSEIKIANSTSESFNLTTVLRQEDALSVIFFLPSTGKSS